MLKIKDLYVGREMWLVYCYYNEGVKPVMRKITEHYKGSYMFKVEGYDFEFDLDSMVSYEYDDDESKICCFATEQEAFDFMENCRLSDKIIKFCKVRPSTLPLKKLQKIIAIIGLDNEQDFMGGKKENSNWEGGEVKFRILDSNGDEVSTKYNGRVRTLDSRNGVEFIFTHLNKSGKYKPYTIEWGVF